MTAQTENKDVSAFKMLFGDIRREINAGLKMHKSVTEIDGQFMDLYTELSLLIDPIERYQQVLAERAPLFDFIQDDGIPIKANGYRSLLYVLKELLSHLLSHLQKHARERGNIFYSPADSLSNITAYTRAMQGIEIMLHYSLELMKACQAPELHNYELRKSLLSLTFTDTICRDAFYGQCLGFQYSQGLRTIVQFLTVAMASYDERYSNGKQLISCLWKGGNYLQDSTQRGIKVADLTDDSSIYFVKAFWSIPEKTAISAAAKIISQNVDICELLEVPGENITLKTLDGDQVTIAHPCSDMNYRPIPMRLISYKRRQGQPCSAYVLKGSLNPPSPGLIIHFHGGGFVAQSSKFHEFYLRNWSRDLDCPVLSVDYSLAPEAPYPHGLNDCLFAYVWALNNFEMLGTTGEKILLVGDSAGGCFTITTSMKIKQLRLRLPDQIFSFYPPCFVRTAISPSRFMSLIDPILPVGIMISCLQSYTGNPPSDELIALRKETRSKILRSKGHIIPSLDNPYVIAKPPTRWKKLKGRLRSRSVTTFTDEHDTMLSKTKSFTTPPTTPTLPTDKTNRSVSVSNPIYPPGSIIDSPSVSFQIDDDVKEDEIDKQIVNREETKGTQEDDSERQGYLGQELGLSEATSPILFPMNQSQYTNSNSQYDEVDLDTIAPCFHKQDDSGHRLGRRTPSKEELLTEEEITKMIDEIMKTYEDAEITEDPFISPALSPDDLLRGLPPVNLVVCSLDPLLDDGVMMAQRLKSLGQPVTLTVIDNLCHGFLCLRGTDQLTAAHNRCVQMLNEALK